MNTITELGRLQGLSDAADDIEPTDMEILDVLVETFGGTAAQMIERLICMDFVTLRSELP